MSLVKYAGVSLIAMSASMGHAGGMEDSALSAGFMFENGSYGSVSAKSQTPSLKATVGGVSATSGSVVGSVTSTNIQVKADAFDNLSVGVAFYRQAGIKLDYQANWSLGGNAVAATLPKVDLDVNAIVLLTKYDVNDNFSVLAGLKNGTAKDAVVKIPSSLVDAAVTGGSALSYVLGAAYEMPEIALRAEVVYETSGEYVLDTTFTGIGAGTVKASTANYMNVYVQSGIAEDTLLFVSARQADWLTNQVSIKHAGTGGAYANISDFSDTTGYRIGLGRKFGDTWSSSLSYNWEGGSGATTGSPLTLSNGNQGVSIGAKYALNDSSAITFGGNYTEFGDIDGTWAAGTPLGANAKFSGNSVTTLGAQFSHSF